MRETKKDLENILKYIDSNTIKKINAIINEDNRLDFERLLGEMLAQKYLDIILDAESDRPTRTKNERINLLKEIFELIEKIYIKNPELNINQALLKIIFRLPNNEDIGIDYIKFINVLWCNKTLIKSDIILSELYMILIENKNIKAMLYVLLKDLDIEISLIQSTNELGWALREALNKLPNLSEIEKEELLMGLISPIILEESSSGVPRSRGK